MLLPLSNQSEWPAAAAVVAETVKETLEKDKRYVVRSFSSSDPVGEVAWFLWNREVGSDTAKKGLRALCETYKADAALSVGIVSYHKALEEAPFVGSRSQLDYRSVWATHLSLKATLWGLRTEQIVWRQERTDRIYHGRTMGPSHRQETAARSVVRDLFKTFPVRSDR
ncbi:MAG: hypothetical protein VKN33_02070 [Candidatus Sericytochromatia bacterium]|nr:hypothetical protein [Candidatus Sericytochromatia bacterium]